jgi:hypothetical protein
MNTFVRRDKTMPQTNNECAFSTTIEVTASVAFGVFFSHALWSRFATSLQ